ncbi:MAG TPA: hypothetical protein DHW42_10320 [Candidatus Marinimicrobia bacterium]|nr:hypothetical protein [Candidatus Neomarinimicrobiota bacterium]
MCFLELSLSRSSLKIIVCVIFGLLLTVGLSARATIWQTDSLLLSPDDSLIILSKTCVIPASLIVNDSTGRVIDTETWSIDALTGKISNITVSDSTKIIVRYQYLDIAFPRQMILNPPPRVYFPESPKQESKIPAQRVQKNSLSSNYDFLKSGTIYRGVSVGSNSGLSLQAGLNLELQGQLSEDISIVGSLSDQNIPIQPEGNTQTIDEIDKVFIQVRMPKERITFGDYEFSSMLGNFGAYRRKLQGVMIESKRHGNHAQLSGAITKGQYTTNYFTGEESNQGPYQLIGKEGETAIIVLAGTEKIWLNGQEMKRGENGDYVIDYSTGEVTFTPHRLITSNSRITVDFQYSNLVYQKNIWVARNSADLAGGKVKLSAGFISESDDKDNPIEIVLTDIDRQQLKSIGDNEQQAFQTTIEEDSNGVYQLIDSILIYAGQGKGTHSASFYHVGSKGKYKKVYGADFAFFEYVDKTDSAVSASDIEEAVYLPVKPLKLPKRQRLYHLSGQWHPSKYVSFSSELAGSDLDRNSFSTIDDHDNTDVAFDLKTDICVPLSTVGKAAVQLNYRQIGERFEPIDRVQEVEYRRKWDLLSDSTQGEKVFEGGLNLNFKDVIKWRLELGSYNRSGIDAGRYSVSGVVHYKWLDRLELSQEQIRRSSTALNSSDWVRQRLLFRFNLFKVNPFTEFRREERTVNSKGYDNFQFIEQRYGVDMVKKKKLTGRIEIYSRKDNELLNNHWTQSTSARNLAVSGQLNDWKSFYSRFSYTYRKKKYFGNSMSPDQDIQLMDIMLKQNPGSLPFHWETNMKIEEERTVKKEYRYFYVGRGEGQYLYDSTFADYIPHVQGDYILRIIPTQIKEPVTSIQNGLRFQINGRRLKEKISWELPTRITTLTDIRLRQQIRESDNPIAILAVSGEQIDDRWVYFNRSVQQDVIYKMDGRKSDIRFRFLDTYKISQMDVRGREKSMGQENSIRYKGYFWKSIRLESGLAYKSLYRKSYFNSLRDRDIRSVQMSNSFSYLLNGVHLFECQLTGSYDAAQSGHEIETLLFGVRNSYERKLKSKGRWKGFVEFNDVNVTPVGSPIPWEMGNGKKAGVTLGWGLSVEYRLGKNMSVRCNYEGWSEPDRDIYHLGGGEIRALF